MEQTGLFEAERPRLVAVATRVLGDHGEAEDVVQEAWLRLQRTETPIESLPAWLTTVTTRLCLDRLRVRVPEPVQEVGEDGGVREWERGAGTATTDPAEDLALAESVGVALQVVLDRLTPAERVAFVLHDSFGVDFATIAEVLESTPAAARKLASRARARIGHPVGQDELADWQVVDAFMAAARRGDFAGLLRLLAPEVAVRADAEAILLGTPERIDGREAVAAFFNGSAQAALPVFRGPRPGVAWFDRGRAMVLFDFDVVDGRVQQITFRAEPRVLTELVRRADARRKG